MAGLREELELDASQAFRQIDAIEAALGAAAKSFRVDLAHALDVLRSTGDVVVDVTADTKDVTRAIDRAVEAADSGVLIDADAKDVTGSINAAVGDADTEVDVDVDPAAFRQLKSELDRVNAELADTKQALNKVETELEQVDRAGHKAAGAFDGIRNSAAAGLGAIGAAGVIRGIMSAVDAASDLAESGSKVSVVFGESAPVIEAWAETSATSVGLAKQEALEAAGTFGNLFVALGSTKSEATDLAPQVVQLAADLASFNNLGVDETLEKLRSGLVGEIEPLRSLGVSFGAAEVEAQAMQMGLADANGEVSEGAKLQARFALVLSQTTAAQGDFARTSDGLANQSRILQAEIGNARAELGERLLPIMLKVVGGGRSLLDFFTSLPEPVQNAVLAFGALGATLGPILLVSGNVAKGVQGIGTAVSAMAKVLGTSSLVVGGWAAALLALGLVFMAFKAHQQAVIEYQTGISDGVLETVNSMALLSEETATSGAGMKRAAVDAYMAAGGIGDLGDSASDTAAEISMGSKIAVDSLKAIEDQTPKARIVLQNLADASGVTRERIVQLATAMGINLAEATDEQREKLAAAVSGISGAVKPTDRLADAAGTLGNEFATAEEQIKAFDEALDAALGVYLSAEEATIRVRQELTELADAFAKGREEGESAQEFQDRMTLSTIGLTRSVEDEVRALTESGEVATDAASQKQALISRLLALADTLKGPMADQLRQHAFRVAAIPDEAVTKVSADTSGATAALTGLAALAKAQGAEVAAQFAAGIVQGFRDKDGVVRASADRIAGTIERAANARLGISSPSKVGMEIGGFFVEGITLGIEHESLLADQAAQALADGLGKVVYEAAQITLSESLAILKAIDNVANAEEALAAVRADNTATTRDVRIAELELTEAQEAVNQAVYEARDATDALAQARRDGEGAAEEAARNERELAAALDASLGALDAVGGVRGAQRSVEKAEAELADARRRARALPGEIADAEKVLSDERARAARTTDAEALAILRAKQSVAKAETNLAEVRGDATSTADELRIAELEVAIASDRLTEAKTNAVAPTREVTAAEKVLEDLRKEQAASAERVRAATAAVTDAQLALVSAQRQLVAAGAELTGSQAEVEAYFRMLAEAAGLSRREVDALVASMLEARRLGENANNAAGGGGGANGGRLINTNTGRAAFTGPNGEGGSASRRGVPGETSWTMPDGTKVWYVPGKNIDQGNLGALGRVRATLPVVRANVPTKPAPTGSKTPATTSRTTNVTINPKKAVYDPKATAATLRTLELLNR